MSDSEDSAGLPSQSRIEQALRQAVTTVFKSGNHEDLTVKRIRAAAEKDLGLPDDFFKSSTEWKDRSKEVISNEVENQEAKEEAEPVSAKKPTKAKAAPVTGSGSKSKPAPQKAKASSAPQKSRKRQSEDSKPKARKRRKVSESPEELLESPLSDVEEASDAVSEPESTPKKSQAPRKRQARKVRKDATPAEASDDDVDEPQRAPAPAESENDEDDGLKDSPALTTGKKEDASESELSELIDEAPAPKKQRKKSGSEKPTKSTKPKSSKTKDETKLDPDQAEIKRLQGWLIKCGIRKMWHRELAPYDTSKAKINHLKEMLRGAGMTGRYSVEKAAQIKEQRELAADLEAVQEGARQWGHSGSDGESGGTRPRRTLAKGLRDLDFLGDDGGEETD